MKFKAKAKGFLNGLEPVITVATKGTAKDYPSAFFVTLIASEDGITASSDGGKMSLTNKLDALNQSVLNYECMVPGSVTVRALDIRKMLQSFNAEDEIMFELRESSKDAEEPISDVPVSDNSENVDVDGEQINEAAQQALLSSGQEVFCTLMSDTEEFQTIPCAVINIDPKPSEKIEDGSDLTIRRDIFVSSANRISFAQGFQEYRPAYLYWVIRVNKNTVRFVAGSGGRFAVLEMTGEGITNASKRKNILIPNWPTPALIDVFGKLSGDYVSFFVGERELVIRCGSVQAIISQIDPNIKWPDESSILDRSNKIKMTTKVGNWLNAVRGISATYSEDIKKQRHVHTANITLDLKNKMLLAKSNDQLKSNRKVTVDDVWSDGSSKSITFKCVSQYLAEAVKHGNENEYIQVEIDSDSTPIVIRYHAGAKIGETEFKKDTELGVKERYTIFFAPRTKDN